MTTSVIVKRFLGRRPSLLHLLKALALVMPSACGPDEIYHLKESLSSILILTVILHFVKDFLVLQQSRPFFLVRFHECNDGIFKIIWLI